MNLEFDFLVANNDIPGLPGLTKGDPVIRAAVEVLPGGYEYDVWHLLDHGGVAKTRIDHRGEFMECHIDGETKEELQEKVLEISNGMRKA